MKGLIFAAFFIVLFLFPKANIAQNNSAISCASLYVNLGIGIVPSGPIFGIGINTLYSNNWGGSFAFNHNEWQSDNLPSNYARGIMNNIPVDFINSFAIRVVKIFPNIDNKIRFGLAGGLNLMQYEKKYFVINPYPGWFGSNYNEIYTDKYSIGISLKAKVEFCLFKYLGLQVAVISNINQYQPYIGGEIQLITGKLR
ncbi:MAG: hypothetical protein K9G64_04025 [Bacteroidia bacterium]|nr:hypothetical protein [Bacteroidia bacterium]